MSTPDQLARLAQRIEQERVDRGWSKEQAAREAGISSITWKRIEDGKHVQDMKLRAVEISLGWEYGSTKRIMDGRGPVAMVAEGERAEPVRPNGRSHPLWDAFQAVHEFARLAREAGGAPEFEDDLYKAAIALMASVERYNELMSKDDVELAGRRGQLQKTEDDVALDLAGEESQDPEVPL